MAQDCLVDARAELSASKETTRRLAMIVSSLEGFTGSRDNDLSDSSPQDGGPLHKRTDQPQGSPVLLIPPAQASPIEITDSSDSDELGNTIDICRVRTAEDAANDRSFILESPLQTASYSNVYV
ncbi:hypothetical protein JCM16303_000410 [Sporobolomyces ruberrimus]